MLGISLFLKKKRTRVLKPTSFNPPKKSLKPGSYTIEAYCRDTYSRLFFITLNYETWEEACKTRNEMVGNDHLTIHFDGKEHHYSVLSTKILKVGCDE